MVKIAFSSSGFSERGTEVALYDYANCNETILGNESIIVMQENPDSKLEVIDKFKKRFKVLFHDPNSQYELDKILEKEKCDYRYEIKFGLNDRLMSSVCKNLIHCVFDISQPHGDKYVAICEWLSKSRTNGKIPWVPHIIEVPDCNNENMRNELNIPKDALVFGRHGGQTTFNLPFVHDMVYCIANMHPNIYFIFLNTSKFCPNMPNIIHLNMTVDINEKIKFINTCDAMLHARSQGEVFSIALGEFAKRNKPILTYSNPLDKGHFFVFKDKLLIYNDDIELYNLITTFKEKIDPLADWDPYKDKFNGINVMKQFKEVFLDD
jgi:hypothetical protein